MTTTTTVTDWTDIRRKAHEGRYLFGSVERIAAEARWMRRFRQEATEHGAEIEITRGHVYVVFHPPWAENNGDIYCNDCGPKRQLLGAQIIKVEDTNEIPSDWACGACNRLVGGTGKPDDGLGPNDTLDQPFISGQERKGQTP